MFVKKKKYIYIYIYIKSTLSPQTHGIDDNLFIMLLDNLKHHQVKLNMS